MLLVYERDPGVGLRLEAASLRRRGTRRVVAGADRTNREKAIFEISCSPLLGPSLASRPIFEKSRSLIARRARPSVYFFPPFFTPAPEVHGGECSRVLGKSLREVSPPRLELIVRPWDEGFHKFAFRGIIIAVARIDRPCRYGSVFLLLSLLRGSLPPLLSRGVTSSSLEQPAKVRIWSLLVERNESKVKLSSTRVVSVLSIASSTSGSHRWVFLAPSERQSSRYQFRPGSLRARNGRTFVRGGSSTRVYAISASRLYNRRAITCYWHYRAPLR